MYDYPFINNCPIEHVKHCKHLGTVFRNSLKWHDDALHVHSYGKIKSRFMLSPNSMYWVELMFHYCGKGERQMRCKLFNRNRYFRDLWSKYICALETWRNTGRCTRCLIPGLSGFWIVLLPLILASIQFLNIDILNLNRASSSQCLLKIAKWRPAFFYTKPFVYESVAICLIMIKLLHNPV